ncbi:MAG: DEAD/DEAH box helicase family protein [Bdellovibrionaceae bacterium]|nr:DEAD/DEAH box helicase family protein [Pseudobdellovibrionaceae bacterium]
MIFLINYTKFVSAHELDKLVNCERVLALVGPSELWTSQPQTPAEMMTVNILQFQRILTQVVGSSYQLVHRRDDIFDLAPIFNGIQWSVEFKKGYDVGIYLNKQEKRLVFPDNYSISSVELAALIRQWLVAHPLHPYTAKTQIETPKRFQLEALRVYEAQRLRGENKLLIVSPGSTGKTWILKKVLELNIKQKPLKIIIADQRLGLRQLRSSLSQDGVKNTVWGDGFKVDTDFYKNMDTSPHFLFTTSITFKKWLQQASTKDKEALRQLTDIVIYDEAHHIGAELTYDLLPKWLGEDSDSPFLLGSTATPIHAETNIQDLFDGATFWAYLDTSDNFLANSNSHQREVEDLVTQLELAIREGDVTPIEKINILSSLDLQIEGVPLFISETSDGNGRNVLNTQYYSKVFSRLSPLLEQDGSSFIVTATIAEAERVYDYIRQLYPQKRVKFLHSNISRFELDRIEAELKNSELDIVVAVKMLDESVNVLSLNNYIDLTSSMSPRQFIQRLSRITRLSLGKHYTHSSFFIYVDESTVRESIQLMDRLLKSRMRGHVYNLKQRDIRDFEAPELVDTDSFNEWTRLRNQLYNFWIKTRKTSNERFEELDSFVRTHQRLPSQVAKNPKEKPLGDWLSGIKSRDPVSWYQNLSEDAIKILESKNLLGRQIKTKIERFKELDSFVRTYRRLPSQVAKNPKEKSLGGWLNAYKNRNLESWYQGLSEDVIKILESKNLLGRQIKTKIERFKELDSFVRTYQRLPFNNAEDPEEKSLATWLNSFKNRNSESWHQDLSEDVIKILESKNLLGRQRKTTNERFKELDSFVLAHQRLPSGRVEDPEEKSLATWLNSFKNRNSESWYQGLSEDVIKILESKNLLGRQIKTTNERFKELDSFVLAHQRLPLASSKNSKEKSLGGWLVKHKSRKPESWYHKLSEGVIKILESKNLLTRLSKIEIKSIS